MTARNALLYRVHAVVPSKAASGNENWIHTDCDYMDARTLVLGYMRRGGKVWVHPEKRQVKRDIWRGLVSGQGKRVATAILLACLCLPLWATESPDKVFRGASIAFGAAVFADAWTSERAFDAGHGEANPTLPEHPTDSRFFAQVIVFDGAVYLYARHLHAKHPGWARAVLIVGAAIHSTAAGHNDRIWDRQER